MAAVLLPPSIGQPCCVYERQQRPSQGLSHYGCSNSHCAAMTEAGAHRVEQSVSVMTIALNAAVEGKVDSISTLVTISRCYYKF